MKICCRCKEDKPLEEFGGYRKAKDGLKSECKSCEREKQRKWRRNNPVKIARRARKAALKCFYGLTLLAYEERLQEQGGVCKICGGNNPSGKQLSVDHDHKTGEIRGLLCSKCNTGIGLFDDSPERLRATANYLDKANHFK